MRFRFFSFAVLILVAAFGIRVARPSVAMADASGTESRSIVHAGDFVRFTIKGMAANSGVTVYASTTATEQGVLDRSQATTTTDASGNGDVLIYVSSLVPSGYAGPLFVTVCDSAGSCLIFTLTMRAEMTESPLPVGPAANNGMQQDCYMFQLILQGHIQQKEVRLWLLAQNLQNSTGLGSLLVNCGLGPFEQGAILQQILEVLAGD
jgi:hypothetical protein